jgi:hypothetical protein
LPFKVKEFTEICPCTKKFCVLIFMIKDWYLWYIM